ncbi:MAG TPA: TonB-dependent receptor [Steroidobacteraceae bacterium]|nr:TonB-dependent receptor [Steroidobacteraceae bacterium]
MNPQKCLRGLLLAVLTTGLALPAAQAQAEESSAPVVKASAGAIVGIVTNSAKIPVAGATVTAIRVDGGGIRATVSNSDGVYSFADLAPGAWSITVQVDGYPDATVPSLQVAASKATRHDLVMNVPAAAPAAPPALAAAQKPAAQSESAAQPEIAAQAKPAVVAKSSPSTSSLWSQLWAPAKPAAADAQSVPDALHSPDATEGVDNFTPFAFGDFTWLNGSPRNKAPVFDTKFFTPDIRFDAHYMQDFNRPKDHTIVGSTESFRSGEFQLEQVSFGGDFHWENVRARFLSMMGLFATTTPRNDASSGVGQWDLSNAYRYLSEANAGYHFDVGHGLNVDAGIFVSYIGLFSYYNYDNWTYQPSYVSSNTPWFFNGLRIQYFPTNTLKIEPWIINGWQSYGRFNKNLGFGGQILWQPNENLKLVFNNYGVGEDNLAYSLPGGPPNPIRNANRVHTDDSIEFKYFDSKLNGKGLSKAAFSFTFDAGCEYGGGVGGLSCTKGPNKTAFVGWMFYNRLWFDNDLYAVTIGGGSMNNPGRYLTLLPPINGATAATGTPYFTENPGQPIFQWDATLNLQYMPKQWITWWAEAGFRHSSVPYFSGQGGVTPPFGNNGSPSQYACNDGTPAGTSLTSTSCANNGGVWYPDLRTRQATLSGGILVKF